MKKGIALILCLVLALSFAACGTKPAGTTAAEPTAAPAAAVTEAPTAEPAAPAEATAEPAPAADPVAEMKELVLSLKDHPVDELYAAIGEPLSASYASSCLVMGGQDGVLEYDGFTVYTLVSNGQETVYDVE